MSGAGPAHAVPAAAAAVQSPFPRRSEWFGQFGDKSRSRWLREMPVNTEWDRAARAFLIVTNQQTVRPANLTIKPTRRITSTHHY
jgi:hypothetical protein